MATTSDHPSERSHERQRVEKGRLPRLAPEHYRARAFAHWTLTLEDRATGWLTPAFHHTWQHTLLHACARYGLACPVYVLLPDHAHLLLIGLLDGSDQRLAVEFLRKHLRPALAPCDWQHQTQDHVLRDNERERDAFQTIAHYILENPVRAGLVTNRSDYTYTGCCVPGYPEFAVHTDDYWLRFWRLYNYLVSKP